MEISFLVAFSLGLTSTLHCWGMCGGIVGALSIGFTEKDTFPLNKKSVYLLALNTGRITSYTIAGLIAGLLGVKISQLISPEYGHTILRVLSGVILIIIGLHLAGWLPVFRSLESIGNVIWKHIQPLGKKLLPVNTISKAFSIGMIWGWLPCALVYSVLFWSITSGSILNSVLIMFAFGLGTLPSMFMAGIAGSELFSFSKRQSLRKFAGILIIIFGLVSPFITITHHTHAI